MQRVPVDSSSIASIDYAPEQQVLELEFKESGEVYQILRCARRGTHRLHRRRFQRCLSQPALQAPTVSLSSGLAPAGIT